MRYVNNTNWVYYITGVLVFLLLGSIFVTWLHIAPNWTDFAAWYAVLALLEHQAHRRHEAADYD